MKSVQVIIRIFEFHIFYIACDWLNLLNWPDRYVLYVMRKLLI